jgi:hypothetical protein
MMVKLRGCDPIVNNDSSVDLLHTWRKKPWELYMDDQANYSSVTKSYTWTEALQKIVQLH